MESHFHRHSDADVLGVAFHNVGEHTDSLLQFHQGKNVRSGVKALSPVLISHGVSPYSTSAGGGKPFNVARPTIGADTSRVPLELITCL